jgi:hypothetical protein
MAMLAWVGHAHVGRPTGTQSIDFRRFLRSLPLGEALFEHAYEFLRNIVRQKRVIAPNSGIDRVPHVFHMGEMQALCAGSFPKQNWAWGPLAAFTLAGRVDEERLYWLWPGDCG